MRIGLITDVHEDVPALEWALALLAREGVDRIMCLGDVCEDGRRITETCECLAMAGALCVWGNHDYGLCTSPAEQLKASFDERTIAFMQSMTAEQIVEDCAFRHIEPCLDPYDLADLWHLPDDFETADRLASNWAAARVRRTFMGHLHRWFAASERGPIQWAGDRPLQTAGLDRCLVVIDAVRNGQCASLDTVSGELLPFHRG